MQPVFVILGATAVGKTDLSLDLAELIDGLIKCPTAGHQYLTRYPDEDAIAVVSKGEYGDEMLESEQEVGERRAEPTRPEAQQAENE